MTHSKNHSVHEIAAAGVHKAPRARMGRATGGETTDRTGPNNVGPAAKAKAMTAKRGGRAKKQVGMVDGEMAMGHAGRKPRKSGVGVEANPFSSARSGTPAKGRGSKEMC